MLDFLIRTEMLIGKENTIKLQNSTIAVFGLGGVGSYTVEALVRSGIGNIVICDNDTVDVSNINRQLFATNSTIGARKTEVAKNRILDINPQCNVTMVDCFFGEDTKGLFDFANYDYVVDAIDTITSKLLLVELCKKHNTEIISCMGTGNKLTANFEVADIYDTQNCPLARVMRRELKARNIDNLKVVYSKDESLPHAFEVETEGKRQTPASISFVPPVAGLLLAGEVIRGLLL